jgi:hypothetical protein
VGLILKVMVDDDVVRQLPEAQIMTGSVLESLYTEMAPSGVNTKRNKFILELPRNTSAGGTHIGNYTQQLEHELYFHLFSIEFPHAGIFSRPSRELYLCLGQMSSILADI